MDRKQVSQSLNTGCPVTDLLPGAMSSPPTNGSALGDQEGEAPPVEQIEVKGEDDIDEDSVLGVSSVFDAIS